MALLNTVEKLDDVDKDYQQYYTEKDGKFELVDALRTEDTTALKNALERQKADRIAGEDAIKTLETKAAADAIALAEAQGDKDKADKLRQEALDAQKVAHDKELSDSKALNHELTIGMARDSIANDVYINPKGINLSVLESRVKLNDDGKTTYLVNALGETCTREALITELKADESMAFAIRAGKGSGGGDGNHDDDDKDRGNDNPVPPSKMTGQQRKDRIAQGPLKR